MKKFSILAAFIAFLGFSVDVGHAIYPAAPQQTMTINGQQMLIARDAQGRQMLVPMGQQQQQVWAQPIQQQRVAAQNTRVTGALPRVGSNNNVAGRQYYQPQDFDRLADSGLYLGVSVGYAMSVTGGMSADYQNEANSYYVPGSFQRTDYKVDSVIPLSVSLGAAINNDVRVDFSYSRYSNLAYGSVALSSDGIGGFIDTQVTGGSISANATLLNVYYNIDSFTGFILGGNLKPYIGAGVGISLNTISDYVIYDGMFYPEIPEGYPSVPGELTAISDIYAYHSGGTTEQLAYMLEAGLTTELQGGLKMDFFVKYSGFGKVKSSGSIVVNQTEWLGTGMGNIGDPDAESPAPYDSVFHYTNWYESGNLSTLDLGIRLRLQF